ncbi:rap GTPase-activating protein, putative [Entamoeba invadens IP1]|uniref:rap GTPase-activating protein, putative n=1 Tax=Entamoeba invadens IP1 TaxID=370355 RepID=UPI0002C3D680|nr:rap GTPase-activating protein, putative [Entamoeba invadens IP1]ELP93430.1 rap GTPase-activating protein, putative [Entamoeba invadens IP1]|eukprot:XP_004260201.1 rap GTPase-activating protein, putative [Entamoeba invadens IP1]
MSLESGVVTSPGCTSDVSSTTLNKSIDEDKYDVARVQLEEENIELKQKIKTYEAGFLQSQNLVKEYRTFINYFPKRGERFCCGKIDKVLKPNDTYAVTYGTQFPEIPKVVCFLNPTIFKLDNSCIIPSQNGFILKTNQFSPIQSEGSFYFWIAYCPIKPKSEKMGEIVDLLKGVKTYTEKEVELQIVKYMKKGSVNDIDGNGRTFLYYACEKSFVGLVEFLLNKSADPNISDENQYSPLHKALSAEKIEKRIVEMLLEKGADRAAKNESLSTPLHYLCRVSNLGQNTETLKVILDVEDKTMDGSVSRKRYVNEANLAGETALTNVCTRSMDVNAIRLLCESGSDANHQTNSGIFPLYSAVLKKNTAALEVLLKYGANIGQIYNGKPLFQIAEEKGQIEKLKKFIKENYMNKTMSDVDITTLADTFETITFPVESWTDNIMMQKSVLVELDNLPPQSHVENYFTCTTHKYDSLLFNNIHDPQACSYYYKNYFKLNEHNNYIIHSDNESSIVSISDDTPNTEKKIKKVIIRTKRFDTRKVFENKTDHQILKELFVDYKEKATFPIRGDAMYNALIRFENFFTYNRYKFGVLYAAPGQTKEMEFYNNRTGSVHFEHFLTLIGQKTKLYGYNGFVGGLDTKNKLTGEYFVANRFSQGKIEITFHVSTYLPYMENNEQQLDKKKHIGNDVVVLVFKEYTGTPEPIDITSFKTQFNHAIIVVGCDLNQHNPPDQVMYSVNIWCKKEVAPVPPFITTDFYVHSPEFGQFLVAKMINAERSAQDSLTFRAKRLTIRQNQLESMMNNFVR